MSKFGKRLKLAAYALRYGSLPVNASSKVIPINPDEAAEARLFFPMPKFFVFGHARSGTTLLARLLRLHPEVHCNWQAHFFTRPPLLKSLVTDPQVADWLSRPSNRWNRGDDLSPVVLRAAADFILERDARRAGKSVVGDKSPNNLLNGESVTLLRSIYPDARLVFIIRDGRDAALSHRFQNFIDAREQLSKQDIAIRDAFAKDPHSFFEGQRSVFTPKSIREAAQGWVDNVQQTTHLGRELFTERFFTLQYEDLLKAPFEQISKLWQFLGVNPKGLEDIVVAEMQSNPDAAWQRQKAGAVAANLEKGRRGSWRDLFTPGDKEVFKEIAGETLITWNYEQDLDW
ncbi:MAG: sulfotransferase [Anaerolineae bacterium]|nr:sulfotransferase [Anaerolineae bacterium]